VRKNSVPVIMVILVLAKVLGFLKLRLIAQLFGATRELDMFWAAFTVPDMLINILILGSINAAIIPVFSKVLNNKGEDYLCRLFYRLNTLTFLLIFLISCIAFIYAESLSNLLVGRHFNLGILQTAEDITGGDISLLTNLTRIILLSPMFLGLSALLSGYLQVYKRFFITALAPLVYNVAIIAFALVLVQNRQLGVHGMAWATVLGSLFHLVTQIPVFIKLSKEQGIWKKLSGVRQDFTEVVNIVKLAIPRVIGAVGEQINALVSVFISLTLSGGALSTYRFAFSLHLFPVQIVGGAVSLVALPNLAEAFSKGKMRIFREIYNKAIQRSLFMILPMIAIIIVLRLPIVRLAYGVGEFDWWSTIITSWCLFLMSFGILGQVLASLSLRAFYAIHETRIPLMIITLTIILNIIGSYYFTNFFSHYTDWRPIVGEILSNQDVFAVWESIKLILRDMFSWFTTRNTSDAAVGGLAMSLSISFLFEAILYIVILHRKTKVLTWVGSIKPFLEKFVSSFLMVVVMYLAFRLTDFSLDTTRTLNVVLILVLTSSLGIGVYLVCCKIFGVQELELISGYWKTLYNYARPRKMLTVIPLLMSDYASYFRVKIDSIFSKNGNGNGNKISEKEHEREEGKNKQKNS
jgi:putative peptidoglycan lipid II flippase